MKSLGIFAIIAVEVFAVVIATKSKLNFFVEFYLTLRVFGICFHEREKKTKIN